MNVKSTSTLAVLMMVLVSAFSGAAVAQETDTYTVTVLLSDAGNATSVGVAVDGTDQSHDLVADGNFSTTLADGAVITLTHSDGTTADYTVGSGDGTVTASDATADYTESLADTGGAGDGTSSDEPDWLTKQIIGAIVIGIVLSWLGLSRGGK
jgi:hypothetical protein